MKLFLERLLGLILRRLLIIKESRATKNTAIKQALPATTTLILLMLLIKMCFRIGSAPKKEAQVVVNSLKRTQIIGVIKEATCHNLESAGLKGKMGIASTE